MSIWPSDIEKLALRLASALMDRELMVATAESCTGGLVVGALTSIPGASSIVDRGFVTYTNDAKVQMLSVDPATLAAHGAVSRETALEMAAGALQHSQAFLSVAVTGIAGPGGGSAQKPVGLVHLAAASRNGKSRYREMQYGDIGRDAVRLATVFTALEMLEEIAQESL